MITAAEATTAEEAAEVQTQLMTALVNAGVDAAGFSPFSVTDALPAVVAKALAYEKRLRADIARASFLELLIATPGSDEWVNRIVRAWFGIQRIGAVKTRGLFRVTAAPAVGAVQVDARSAIAEAGAVLFENRVAFSISGGQAKLVEFEARVAGAAGNVLPGAVTGFKVGKAGLSVTNLSGWNIRAGRDAEGNADYVARGRARFAARAPGGSRAAYLVWVPEAFEAVDIPCTITKIGVDDENPRGPGTTDLYLANATGPATVDELAIVDAYLQPRRGLGTGTLRVLAAANREIVIAGTLYSTVATSRTDALAKWAALASDLPLGGGIKHRLFLDAIRGAVLGPDGVAGVYKFDISSPTGDTKLSTYDVVTFNADGVGLVVG